MKLFDCQLVSSVYYLCSSMQACNCYHSLQNCKGWDIEKYSTIKNRQVADRTQRALVFLSYFSISENVFEVWLSAIIFSDLLWKFAKVSEVPTELEERSPSYTMNTARLTSPPLPSAPPVPPWSLTPPSLRTRRRRAVPTAVMRRSRRTPETTAKVGGARGFSQ